MPIDERLLRHLYRYDQSLPLLATSETEAVTDQTTSPPTPRPDLVRERVTFGSTHDERVLATVTRGASEGARPAVILQHGSAGMGRHTWARRPFDLALAEAGFLVIAVDAPGFGGREAPDNRGRLGTHRGDLLFRTRDNRIQAVQDLMRTVDYLRSRDDVTSIGYLGVSMGTRIGVPFVALDDRVATAVFFVGGSGEYARLAVAGTDLDHLIEDEQLVFELTDPLQFAPMIAGRPVFVANGTRDTLVGREAGERLQSAFAEPRTLRWFDGGHGDSALAFDDARGFLVQQLAPSMAPQPSGVA
jgi:dienelactone hydrolase